MKNLLSSYLFLILLAVVITPAVATAQNDSPSPSAKELRQQLNELQGQLKKVQARLDELESEKISETPQPTQAPPPAEAGNTQTSQPPRQSSTSPQVGEATAAYNEFSEDPQAAPRYNNLPLDPKYHGFFRLPGTQTILKIGGYFKTDFIYDLKPPGNTAAFVPSSIPIPQIATVNNSNISIQPTRMSLDFRIPSSKIGEVRFYVEGDLFGTNSTTPRLRHAYAQAANLLVGQTFTNFMDPDGFPDTLDFQGPNGIVSLRNPQVRYGFALRKNLTLYFAAEKPSSDVLFKTAQFNSQPNAPSPDGTVRLRQEFERGHFQIAGIVRDIAAFVTEGTEEKTGTVIGWGVNVSAGVKTFGRDNIVFGAAAGQGISRYIQDTSGLGIDAEVSTAGGSSHLKATPDVGVDAAYQHYWKKTLRSSLVYSYAAVNNPPVSAFVPATTYNHSDYGAVNLIWNPFGSSLNVGAEVLYGWQQLQNGSKGDDTRIQFSAKYTFVKIGDDRK